MKSENFTAEVLRTFRQVKVAALKMELIELQEEDVETKLMDSDLALLPKYF